jgi:Putative auto-transporter adhesin, head GIN domain
MAIAEREVNGFDEIELRGIGSLFVEQGEREYLRIEAADEVMRAIRTEVVGKRLIISYDWESALLLLGSAAPLDFHVGVTELKALVVSGSGSVTGHDLVADSLSIDISGTASVDLGVTVNELRCRVAGSGEFQLRGQAVHQELRLSGASSYQARDLTSRDIDMDIAGAGKAVVRVSHTLDVSVSGAGTVAYIGDPKVSKTIAGAGKVTMIAS